MTTFIRRTPGILNEADNTYSAPTETTVAGEAIQKKRQNYQRYLALGLQVATMPTLFFTPTTYGEVPQVGDTVEWPPASGQVFTVKDVDPLAPDGVVIAADVVIAK